MVKKLKMVQQFHLAPISIGWLFWFEIWETQGEVRVKKIEWVCDLRPRRPTRQSTTGVGTKSLQRHCQEDQNGTTMPSSTFGHGLALLV
jgi:hypothetical protein